RLRARQLAIAGPVARRAAALACRDAAGPHATDGGPALRAAARSRRRAGADLLPGALPCRGRSAMNTGMDIVRAVKSGELLAEEAIERCIARIEATDATVNAFTDGTFERAWREARAIDRHRAAGAPLPPLAG